MIFWSCQKALEYPAPWSYSIRSSVSYIPRLTGRLSVITHTSPPLPHRPHVHHHFLSAYTRIHIRSCHSLVHSAGAIRCECVIEWLCSPPIISGLFIPSFSAHTWGRYAKLEVRHRKNYRMNGNHMNTEINKLRNGKVCSKSQNLMKNLVQSRRSCPIAIRATIWCETGLATVIERSKCVFYLFSPNSFRVFCLPGSSQFISGSRLLDVFSLWNSYTHTHTHARIPVNPEGSRVIINSGQLHADLQDCSSTLPGTNNCQCNRTQKTAIFSIDSKIPPYDFFANSRHTHTRAHTNA